MFSKRRRRRRGTLRQSKTIETKAADNKDRQKRKTITLTFPLELGLARLATLEGERRGR
jgi:hypothetical protein